MTLCGLQWLLANFGGKTAAQCREIAEIVFTRLKASSSSGDAFRPFLVEEGRRGDVDAASGAPGSAQSKLYVCTASVKRLTRLQLCSAKASSSGEPIDNAKGILG